MLSEIMTFICSVEVGIFTMLDGTQIDTFTYLDLIVALMYLDIGFNFIQKLRSPEQ